MIKISITKEEIEKCRKFASEVVGKTYDRFKQSDNERENRIFFGKLGELLFLKLLNSRGVNPNFKQMFEIWDSENRGDDFDFETKENKRVDIKTAYKENHKLLMVGEEQFEKNKVEIYVGVKINKEITEIEIFGFCSKDELAKNKKRDFGEGLAYWRPLTSLEDIEILIKQF